MSPAIIIDIALIAILLFTAYTYMRSGFLASITRLVGNLLSLLGAMLVANKFSPTVFDNFFKSGLINKTAQTITEKGSVYLKEFIENIQAFFPRNFVDDIIVKADALMGSGAPDLAQQIVEQVVAPLMVPVISVVVFFATYAICRFIVAQVSAILTNVNRVPILGGVNKILGFATGVFGGILEIVLVLCAVWAIIAITGGAIPFLNEEVLSGSRLYTLFSEYNPFI
ncbi:MAG: CvpA family protein [Oscillospiraceae bacterium]